MKRVIQTVFLTLVLTSCQNAENKEIQNSSTTQKLLADIEGVYAFSDTLSKCNLTLEITNEIESYEYKLKTPTRSLTGKISIEENKGNDTYNLTLNGIEWSEYYGALDENSEPIDQNVSLPKGLEGTLDKNVITIQNAGNSMNSYLQLGECDVKYIHLEKQ
ncbi:MAG: hypothetical protein ACI9XB_000696 [Gammaproteobacteria bacterium]|jgi:hypothetical protein